MTRETAKTWLVTSSRRDNNQSNKWANCCDLPINN